MASHRRKTEDDSTGGEPAPDVQSEPETDAAPPEETDVGDQPAEEEAAEPCPITVEPVSDAAFEAAYGGAFRASCAACGYTSELRSDANKAAAEASEHGCEAK